MGFIVALEVGLVVVWEVVREVTLRVILKLLISRR